MIYIVQFYFEDVHASLVSQMPSSSNPLYDPKCKVLYCTHRLDNFQYGNKHGIGPHPLHKQKGLSKNTNILEVCLVFWFSFLDF